MRRYFTLWIVLTCIACGETAPTTDVTDPAETDASNPEPDCTTEAAPGCDEACQALGEAECDADETCRAYFGDRRDDARDCIEVGRFATCRHVDYDVDLGIDNWTQRGPDGACWLFNPGQSHPNFTGGCDFATQFDGVPECP